MFAAIWNQLKAQPNSARIKNSQEIKNKYRHWRIRMMYGMLVGYGTFYFLRKNFSMAMPVMLEETGYTKTEFGLILMICSLLYGVGKFLNGMLADRANPRYFMALGLFGSAVMNIFFGLSGSLTFFGVFWIINHWFQAMGWPPCARMLTHWYGPRELGTMWGVWNS